MIGWSVTLMPFPPFPKRSFSCVTNPSSPNLLIANSHPANNLNHLLFPFLVILGIDTRKIKGIGHGGGTPQKEEGTGNEVPWRWHCFCCCARNQNE
jgi:hypothetical protein